MTLATDRDPWEHLGDRASARVGTMATIVGSPPHRGELPAGPEALARRQKSESFWGMSCLDVHRAVIEGKLGVPFQIPPRSVWHPWLPLGYLGIGREGPTRNTRVARQRSETTIESGDAE